jgi:ankyrin repeat protein
MLKYNQYILESKKVIDPQIIKVVKNGNNNELIKILKNKSTGIDEKNSGGETALTLACKESLLFIVDTLLKYDADVNLSDSDGDTPLMLARTPKIIDMLLNVKNIDINKRNLKNETALFNASNGNKYKLEKLLEFDNIDVNIQNKWGKNAIMNYIDNNIPEIIVLEKMLDKGLDLSLKNKDGDNLYYMLKAQIEHLEKFIKINYEKIEKFIIFENYINERFPEFKKEWRNDVGLKRSMKKYNIGL